MANGPVVKKSTTFREAVPRPLQGLYDYFADDPLGGLAPMGVAVKAPVSVVGALKGLYKSIPVGKAVAEEAAEMSQAMQAVEPFAQRMAASSRVTPHRLGHREQLRVPAFAKEMLEFAPGSTPYPSRPQPLVEKYITQRTFEEGAGLSPVWARRAGPFGSEVNREMRLGIESPKVTSATELPWIAKTASPATATTKKPLLGKHAQHAQVSAKVRSRFSDDDIRTIRREFDEKGFSEDLVRDVARRRGASPSTIKDIVRRMSHIHVK